MRRFLTVLILLLPAAVKACPDLTPYYPGAAPNWARLAADLTPLMPECLQDSEYFALLGAAQLYSGDLALALESLERALLLEPDNGAALIDYALALYEQGQIFAALEINQRLLNRADLPQNLQPELQRRQQSWLTMTRQTAYQLDLLGGYDNNLNGAPRDSQLTLTLSGEPVLLTLNPEFQPASGPYLNLRSSARHRRLAPGYQHSFSAALSGRLSDDTASDTLQLDLRYGLIRPDPRHAWQLETGVSSLMFGGSPLFTGTGVSLRYQPRGDERCRPVFSVATQHQLFHNQSQLNALESRLGSGGLCAFTAFNGSGQQRLGLELAYINNINLNEGRLGGDREGWQANLSWQHPLYRGDLRLQFNHTRLRDRQGYSELLENNAVRWQNRNYLLLQYRQPLAWLGRNASFMANVYYQYQRSNIELFRISDTAAEMGLSFGF